MHYYIYTFIIMKGTYNMFILIYEDFDYRFFLYFFFSCFDIFRFEKWSYLKIPN